MRTAAVVRVSDVSLMLFSWFGFSLRSDYAHVCHALDSLPSSLTQKEKAVWLLEQQACQDQKNCLFALICWGLFCPVWGPVSGRHNLCPRRNHSTFQQTHRQGCKAGKMQQSIVVCSVTFST